MRTRSVFKTIAEHFLGLGVMVSVLCLAAIFTGCESAGNNDENHKPDIGYVSFQTEWEAPSGYSGRQTLADDDLNICIDYGVSEIHSIVINDAGSTLKEGRWDCTAGKAELLGVTSGTGRRLIVEGYLENTVKPNWHYRSEPFTIQSGRTTDLGPVFLKYQGIDASGPEIVERYPTQQNSPVSWDTVIRVRFGEPVVTRTLNATNCMLERVDAQNSLSMVDCDIRFEAAEASAGAIAFTMAPIADLQPGTEYKVTIENVQDLAANLITPISWAFTTVTDRWKMVSAGGSYATGIRQDGTLWAWGINREGQMGLDPTQFYRSSLPAKVGEANDWDSIASVSLNVPLLPYGGGHTLALKKDGGLWVWGSNQYGKLGTGQADSFVSFPKQILSGVRWKKVAVGFQHSLAISEQKEIWAWGHNVYGQLGHEPLESTPTPRKIKGHGNWQAVAAGDFYTLALKSSNPTAENCDEGCTLWAWGQNNRGQLGLGFFSDFNEPNPEPQQVRPSDGAIWAHIAANNDTSYAIDTAGRLFIWGDNRQCQYGDENAAPRSEPVPGEDIGGTDWIAVFAGDNHVIAIRGNPTQQSIWTWGSDNSFGQLGDDPTRLDSCSPGKLIFGSDLETADQWVAGAAGGSTSFAINSDGMLYAWGDNRAGQAGISQNLEPQIIDEELLWEDIASGTLHSMAVTKDHELFGWGNNEEGQIGDGTTTHKQAPIQIEQTVQWAQVATGLMHTVALDIDGNLYTWGSNIAGQLGDESIDGGRNRPGPIQFKDDITPDTEVWTDIAAGSLFTLAINGEGYFSTLWGWGQNMYYELGVSNGDFCEASDQLDDGHCRRIFFPVKIDIIDENNNQYPPLSVAAGSSSAAAILGDEQIAHWGNLLSLNNSLIKTPAIVPYHYDWHSLAIGYNHILALKDNQHLYAWGDNSNGQLGIDLEGKSYTTEPVLADAFGPMKRISAGTGTSFGILNDGTLMAWGNNDFGQLGDGTTETRLTPIVIPHPRGLEWLKVSAGNCHVLAIDQNHHLWSWGCNIGGQLGNGQAWVAIPTRIH